MIPLHIVGGVYRERCQWPMPETDNVFGSAGRAAAALQGTGIERILHTYIGPDLNDTIELILGGFEFEIEKRARPVDPVFEYSSLSGGAEYNAQPRHYSENDTHSRHCRRTIRLACWKERRRRLRDVRLRSTIGLPAGWISGQWQPAKRLALVANSGEVKALTKTPDLTAAATELLASEEAEVVVVKCGLDGAIVASANGVARILHSPSTLPRPSARVMFSWQCSPRAGCMTVLTLLMRH